MQLEAAQAELRSRSLFEATDLGVLLLRKLARPAARAWLGFVLPLQLLVIFGTAELPLGMTIFLLWWWKPLYDRAFGLVLGRGLFRDAPSLGGLYRSLWHDGRRGLVGDLLWRRLHPARSLVLPVALLEGLRGRPAARRRRTIAEGSITHVGAIIGACGAMELATTAGLLLAGKLMMPEEIDWITEDFELARHSLKLGALAAYLLALAVVEPLFVSAGFGLYVSRRTELEGWDVELTFRRMARRLQGERALGSGLLLVLALCLPGAERVSAQSAAPVSESAVDEARRLPLPELARDDAAQRAMERVLARPELARSRYEEHWQLRRPWTPAASERRSDWLEPLANAVAVGLTYLLWAAVVVALSVLVFLLLSRWRNPLRKASEAEATLPAFAAEVAFGAGAFELTPREVVARARALLHEGQDVAALSLLYVGTLSVLMREHGLHLPPEATEGQCLRVVRDAPIASERRTLFSDLTSLWQLSAYAHEQPPEARVQEVCSRFQACFGGAR